MSLPLKYLESMKELLKEDYDAYLESFHDNRLYGLRINTLKISPEEFLKTISNVLKFEGYAKIAKKIGVTREGLYKSFSGKSKPRFETIYKTIDSLGLKFDIVLKKQKSI